MNRKKFFFLVLLLGVLVPTAFGLDIMGPPTATLKKGQFASGFEYFYSRMDVEISSAVVAGVAFPGNVTLDDFESNRYYAHLAYGLADNWEVFGRIGTGEAKVDDNGLIFNGRNKFAGNVGTRITFQQDDNISWGALGQMSWLNSDGSHTVSGTTVDYEVDAQEIQFAVGPTIDMGEWSLYGGALYYQMDGDIDAKTSATKASADIEVDSVFGGYIGAEFEVVSGALTLGTEFTFTGEGYGIGANVIYRF